MGLMTYFANPRRFSKLADQLIPLCAGASIVSFVMGVYYALFASPPDYQQGESVRIMYIHVPAAWVSLGLYMAMAVAAGISLVARHALTDIFCRAAAPIGATLVGICLITGSLWGKPTWGAWWVWDARLTSVLILFLLYCGYIVLRNAFEDEEAGSKAGAILLLIGAINVPIVRFSVDWWHTLHQPASILRMGKPTIAPEMLRPLFIMAMGYALYTAFLVMLRMKTMLREKRIAVMALTDEA